MFRFGFGEVELSTGKQTSKRNTCCFSGFVYLQAQMHMDPDAVRPVPRDVRSLCILKGPQTKYVLRIRAHVLPVFPASPKPILRDVAARAR